MWRSAAIWRGDTRCETDARDVRGIRDIGHRLGRGHLERGRPGLQRRAVEDHHQRRRRRPELRFEERLGTRRFEVVEDEAARAQGAGDLGREREGDQDDDGPGADHPPRATRDEPAETIEGCHVRGSWPGARWMAVAVRGIGPGIVVAAAETSGRWAPIPPVGPIQSASIVPPIAAS